MALQPYWSKDYQLLAYWERRTIRDLGIIKNDIINFLYHVPKKLKIVISINSQEVQ